MAQALSVDSISRERWDELALAFRDLSFCQCSSYASAAAQRVGALSELVRLMDKQCLVGLAEVRVKKIPLTSVGIAYSNYAPLVMQDGCCYEQRFGHCLDALREEYVNRRRLVLRITPALNGGLLQDVQVNCFKSRGFYPSSRHQLARETFIIDLGRPLEEIRRSFDPKWHRDLARSEAAGITITRSVELSDFDHFDQIFRELASQKGFMPALDVCFFKDVQSKSSFEQKLTLHLAWHDGKLVAGHLGSYVGSTAVYILGASSSKGRELRASYLLQWQAILYGKSVGNSFYDLGGIDQKNNPDVYRFKRRLNGRLVKEIGPYEIAPNRVIKSIIRLAENTRNSILQYRTRKA